MGPACPNCGTPLTWYGQAWGCDRERISFPPHQIPQPGQPMPGQPIGQPAMPGQPPMGPPQGGRMHSPTGQPMGGGGYGQPGPQMGLAPGGPQMGQPPGGPQFGQSPGGPHMGHAPGAPHMGQAPQGPQYGQPPPGPQQFGMTQPGMGASSSSAPGLPVIPKTIPINTFQEQQQQQLAQYPQATQYPASHASHAVGAQPTRPPPKAARNMKPLLIAGGGVVVVAGILIAVVTSRGGSSGTRVGMSSRDGLVRATFESIAKNDIDGLMKRTGNPGLKAYVTCDKRDERSPEEEAEQAEDLKKELKRGLARLSGSVIKIKKIDEGAEKHIIAKDEEIFRGCKLNKPVTMHPVEVSLDIIHDQGTSETHKVEMQVGEIDGQWFYSGIPYLPGCTASVTTIADLGVKESRSEDMVNTLQPKLMQRCFGDEWGAAIEKCVESAQSGGDVAKCLSTLPKPKLEGLGNDMKRLLKDATTAEQRLLAFFPEPEAEKPPEEVAVKPKAPDGVNVDDTYVPDVAQPDPNASDRGLPAQADYADFWLWTREDKAVRVTSPLVEAVFPAGKLEQKLVKAGNKTADGKDFWLYQFVHDLGDDGQLRLEIASLGRNAASVDDKDDPTVKSFAKIGQVKRRKRDVNGVTYIDLEAVEASSGGSLRALIIRDLKRGVLIIGVAATSPKVRAVGTQYLASIKALDPKDPTEDPELLTDVTAKKAGKKYVAQTGNGDFSMELPLQPKITRAGPTDKSHKVTATGIAEKKGMQVSFDLSEFSSWDALTYTPDKQFELANGMKASMEKEIGIQFEVKDAVVAGSPGFNIDSAPKSKPQVQVRMGWNRYQHRMLVVFCLDAKCDTWTESVKWGAPSAE